MSSWSSYPSIYQIGHRAIKDLFNVDVVVEEKVDGSQFSFGLVEPNRDATTGEAIDPIFLTLAPEVCSKTPSHISGDFSLKVRSKGCIMHIDAPEALFKSACATVKKLAEDGLLHPGWTYRGEVLQKAHHNALTYDRVPKDNIILFDVSTGDQEYLSYEDKVAEAHRLGLEVVPRLFSGRIADASEFRKFLENDSILGGQKIEGVVIKPVGYGLYGPDKKVLLGKFVSEAFKEVHRKTWGESNPGAKDVISLIGQTLTTPARWQKALIHLEEQGKITWTVQDIGLIVREVPDDILKEEEAYIREALFKHAWPHIRRIVTRGLPEWFKEVLMKRQFEENPDGPSTGNQSPSGE